MNNNLILSYISILLDEIDKIILSYLGKNARISSAEIANNLQDIGYNITERAIRYRLGRLEKTNTIIGYSAILNP
ncbi:MAG TPA: winged-helix domain-containing protein, partial [Nitrososphaeraceae archaeon]|nr:winged-helix domain-containing protein [Nitrososphaeraceae archaeon]